MIHQDSENRNRVTSEYSALWQRIQAYAAAVSIVGSSSLITWLESIPPYWEAGRMLFHQRMGDPTTAEGKAQLERQSPLNSATRIKTPLLIVHGANDVRVKKRELIRS